MAAMPLKATARATLPSARAADRMALKQYVLPVPPGASTNAQNGLPDRTVVGAPSTTQMPMADNTSSTTNLCEGILQISAYFSLLAHLARLVPVSNGTGNSRPCRLIQVRQRGALRLSRLAFAQQSLLNIQQHGAAQK
eukprot:4937393-Prymnesium_polylepis.1